MVHLGWVLSSWPGRSKNAATHSLGRRPLVVEAWSGLVPTGRCVMSAGQKAAPFFLKRSRDIQHIKKSGRRVSTGLFNLQICPGLFQDAMLGIVIGRRFGTAVRRNRAKRLFRELGRAVRPALVPGHAFLVFPKRECLNLSFAELQNVWRGTLQRQRLARFGEPSP